MATFDKIRKVTYYIAIILFSLITVFMSHSSHFDWGLSAYLITLPFFLLVPLFFIYDLINNFGIEKNQCPIKWQLYTIAILAWFWSYYWIIIE